MVRCQSISLARGRYDARGAIQAAAHRLLHRVGQLALQILHDLAHDLPRRILRLLGDDVAQREQRRHQMHVGVDLLQHLRLQQHLRQVQPLQRVLLHHAHRRRGEVGADVAEPARHVRRRARPARRSARCRRAPPARYPCHRSVPASATSPSLPAPAPPSTSRQRRSRSSLVSHCTGVAHGAHLPVSAPAPAGRSARSRSIGARLAIAALRLPAGRLAAAS